MRPSEAVEVKRSHGMMKNTLCFYQTQLQAIYFLPFLFESMRRVTISLRTFPTDIQSPENLHVNILNSVMSNSDARPRMELAYVLYMQSDMFPSQIGR